MPLTNFSFGLTNVNLWSSENPYLYKLLLTVYDHEDNLVEVIPQKIGFREFKMDQGIMKLNVKELSLEVLIVMNLLLIKVGLLQKRICYTISNL